MCMNVACSTFMNSPDFHQFSHVQSDSDFFLIEICADRLASYHLPPFSGLVSKDDTQNKAIIYFLITKMRYLDSLLILFFS
jgi:hypothetical protein